MFNPVEVMGAVWAEACGVTNASGVMHTTSAMGKIDVMEPTQCIWPLALAILGSLSPLEPLTIQRTGYRVLANNDAIFSANGCPVAAS